MTSSLCTKNEKSTIFVTFQVIDYNSGADIIRDVFYFIINQYGPRRQNTSLADTKCPQDAKRDCG